MLRRRWPRTCRRRDRTRGSASCVAGNHGVRRILIVDDEPSVRDVMATVLLEAGYSVQTAADGHIALEIIDLAPPDLIITDVMMPHLDGWALLDHAHERNPNLPVIVMSAGDWIRRRRTTPIPDHAVFLAKPFAVEELLELVVRLTGSRSS
jgi:two-component system, OmpR family, response regulator